jgi:hypothetical protein
VTKAKREMTAEEIENWLAIRKEAGLHIDPETASIPSFRRNTSKSGGNTSPVLPEAMCGSILATCRSDPRCLVGKAPEKFSVSSWTAILRSWRGTTSCRRRPCKFLEIR